MYQIILFIHVIIAAALIALVLIQQGKGAAIGAAFGSGASSTVFGSQGSASFLMKLTGVLAAAFFITSLTLGYIVSVQYKQSQSLNIPVPVEQTSNVKQKSTPIKNSLPATPAKQTKKKPE